MNTLEYARHRRLRHTASLRSLVRENQLHKSDLIYPIFVAEGEDIKREVSSMPGVFNLSLDHLTAEIEEVVALGIESVILFGVPHDHLKDEQVTVGLSLTVRSIMMRHYRFTSRQQSPKPEQVPTSSRHHR